MTYDSERMEVTVMTSPELADDFRILLENCLAAQLEGGRSSCDIQRKSVSGHSLEDALVTFIIAVGGGAGAGALIKSLAETIAGLRKNSRKGHIKLYERGGVREVSGYTANEVRQFLESSMGWLAPSRERLVRGMSHDGSGRLIDQLYDPISGCYSAPLAIEPEELAKRPRKPVDPKDATLIVAIIDSGIMSHHPYVKGRIIDGMDFTGEGLEDLNGHGTLVTLQFIAGFWSVARDLSGLGLLNVKVLDRNKSGTEEDLVAALDWAKQKGAKTVNLSLGIERPERCGGDCIVCRKVRDLESCDIFVVMAAANHPNKHVCPTAAGPLQMKVGAATPDGQLAAYSGPGASLLVREPILNPIREDNKGEIE